MMIRTALALTLLAVTVAMLPAAVKAGTALPGGPAEGARLTKPQVAAGFGQTFALRANGTLWTWGNNWFAVPSSGINSGINLLRPVQVGKDRDWAAVSARGAMVLALKRDGTLWSLGWNIWWKTEEDLRETARRRLPVQIGKDRDWAAVSAGKTHAAALKNDGTLWAWGINRHGQLGDGTETTRTTPVQIGKDRDWAAVSAGEEHTVALKNDGTLWVWGWNYYGQLGIGARGNPEASIIDTTADHANEYAPVQVGEDRDWMAVSAGHSRTAAIKSDGTLWVWGGEHLRPVQVGEDRDWSTVCIRGYMKAVKTDGTLWVWGLDLTEQLGIGVDFVPGRPPVATGWPVQIGRDTDWSTVSTGDKHSAALKTDGTIWNWGSNLYGELGDGTVTARNVPVTVPIAPVDTSKLIMVHPTWRNGTAKNTEAYPFIKNGHTLIQLRFLGKWLGAAFRFDSEKKEATISKGTVTIRLRQGENAALISQQGEIPRKVSLDVPAMIVHGRLMVPLRFVSETLGAAVSRPTHHGAISGIVITR